MAATHLRHFALLLLGQAFIVFSTFTNLPDVPPGVNFPKYPDWNPFVRASIMVSIDNATLRDQYPREGRLLFLRTQIPALPQPVDRDTPDVLVNTQFALENVTAVQREQGRLAWKFLGEALVQAERWSAVSQIGRGKVLYESREVFSGPAAGFLKTQLAESLQQSFDAQAQAFKVLLEDCDRHRD